MFFDKLWSCLSEAAKRKRVNAVKKLYHIALTYSSMFVMVMAVAGAGARSWFALHEPKVPAKLMKD